MASHSHPVSAPLTFDLPESLIAKMETARASHGFKTVSELVRHAIAEFDFASCDFVTDPYRQISVRVGTAQRTLLKRIARQKHASVGEVLRQAIDALPVKQAGAKKKAAR
jgi:Arc/MetJ-type ribon-helix-helix transcriptional regulator